LIAWSVGRSVDRWLMSMGNRAVWLLCRVWLINYRGTSCCWSRHKMPPRPHWHWPTTRR